MLPSPSPDSSATPDLGFFRGDHATKGFPLAGLDRDALGVVKRPTAKIFRQVQVIREADILGRFGATKGSSFAPPWLPIT